MSVVEIVFISIGLAMDCFAVAVAGSISYGRYNWAKILRMALMFGLFQGIMPLIGWGLGIGFSDFISRFDHWFAFTILSCLGGKMIYESFNDGDGDGRSPYTSFGTLVVLSVATSIDALATGLIFVPLGNLVFLASAIIFAGSFLFTFLGCILGVHFGRRLKLNVGAVGGIILVVIGVKILVEHLFFS
ncbi:MAG: manganese efflux pump MntP family protein [Candidatus Aphodosoma sp.]